MPVSQRRMIWDCPFSFPHLGEASEEVSFDFPAFLSAPLELQEEDSGDPVWAFPIASQGLRYP